MQEFGNIGWFNAGQIQELNRDTLQKWTEEKLIIPITNELYALASHLTTAPLNAERTANIILQPSYASGIWILNQFGMIPEGPCTITSATTKPPLEINQAFGRFSFFQIPKNAFWGFEIKTDQGHPTMVAEREKCILDFFWSENVWDEDNFKRWRINDDFNKLNHEKLTSMAEKWGDEKIISTAKRFSTYIKTENAKIIWL